MTDTKLQTAEERYGHLWAQHDWTGPKVSLGWCDVATCVRCGADDSEYDVGCHPKEKKAP